MKLLEIINADLGYENKIIIKGLNLSIYEKDFIGIVGPNGSGKTTILKTLLGIITRIRGEFNTYPKNGAKKINFSYVPQVHSIDEIFPLSVYDIVKMARIGKKRDDSIINGVLDKVGISKYAGKLFRELSGGLRQRVLIARALAKEPDMLILDEPTNDLDLSGEKKVMDLIENLNDEGITIIMVSHLLNVVINYVNKIGFLHDNSFEIKDISHVVKEDVLKKIYDIEVKIADIDNKKAAIPM